MSANSKIEWTHHTFNPWWGCTKISPGCDHCYAERDAHRFGTGWGTGAERRTFGDRHWNEPLKWDRKASDAAERHRVFCASMADVFDKDAPTGARERLWHLIEATPSLDWLLLTKRIGNAESMLPERWRNALPRNVWLGITVVNQEEADRDIPKLLRVPAHVRFLSCEPLLDHIFFGERVERPSLLMVRQEIQRLRAQSDEQGQMNADTRRRLDAYLAAEQQMLLSQRPAKRDNPLHGADRIDWVIAGGESGPHARPIHPNWARSLRLQCTTAGVPFFFKQWGEWLPSCQPQAATLMPFSGPVAVLQEPSCDLWNEDPGLYALKVGKKRAGRLLDGRTHDEVPA